MENNFVSFAKITAIFAVLFVSSSIIFAQNRDGSIRGGLSVPAAEDLAAQSKTQAAVWKPEPLPAGYGGVTLGMNFDDTKTALLKNREFGYNGERDVSLLPGENRALIETDALKYHVYSFLDRCWFQFSDEKLEVITINLNRERLDHYSVFSALCKKYGNPNSLSPQKSVWKNEEITMSLERPLTLKYMASGSGEGLGGPAPVSVPEASRESFLSGL